MPDISPLIKTDERSKTKSGPFKNKTAFSSGGGIYTTTTKTDVLAAIDAFIATPVQASGGGNLTWTGQKLSVKSAVKCFIDQTGNDLYVGAYIIEDKAKSIQNSQIYQAYPKDSQPIILVRTPSTIGLKRS